jgi:hypothetical protein
MNAIIPADTKAKALSIADSLAVGILLQEHYGILFL